MFLVRDAQSSVLAPLSALSASTHTLPHHNRVNRVYLYPVEFHSDIGRVTQDLLSPYRRRDSWLRVHRSVGRSPGSTRVPPRLILTRRGCPFAVWKICAAPRATMEGVTGEETALGEYVDGASGESAAAVVL